MAGWDGNRKVGTPSGPSRPNPWVEPGCMATRVVSRSPSRASAACTSAPAPPADGPAHDEDVAERQPVLHGRGDLPGVAADEPGPRGLRPRLAGGGGEGVRADVGDLPGARRAGERRRARRPPRSPRPAAGGARAPCRARPRRAAPPGRRRARRRGGRRRRRAGRPRRAGGRTRPTARRGCTVSARAARVGVADGHDGVGERGQRRTRGDAHRLAGLQPQRMPRARPGSRRPRAARPASSSLAPERSTLRTA